MTMHQESKLKDIMYQVREHANLKMLPDYYQIQDIWKRAIQLNRKQNDLIAAGEQDEIVKVFQCKDEELQQVVTIGIKAERNYDRITWFKLLLADYFVYTREMIRKHILNTNNL